MKNFSPSGDVQLEREGRIYEGGLTLFGVSVSEREGLQRMQRKERLLPVGSLHHLVGDILVNVEVVQVDVEDAAGAGGGHGDEGEENKLGKDLVVGMI